MDYTGVHIHRLYEYADIHNASLHVAWVSLRTCVGLFSYYVHNEYAHFHRTYAKRIAYTHRIYNMSIS